MKKYIMLAIVVLLAFVSVPMIMNIITGGDVDGHAFSNVFSRLIAIEQPINLSQFFSEVRAGLSGFDQVAEDFPLLAPLAFIGDFFAIIASIVALLINAMVIVFQLIWAIVQTPFIPNV